MLTGGNPFYLRWMMRITGVDEIIRELVEQGKVYVATSAGAVVAGATLRHFDNQDDPNEAGEVIWEGLHLTPRLWWCRTSTTPSSGPGAEKRARS